jgi:hypothetical protein
MAGVGEVSETEDFRGRFERYRAESISERTVLCRKELLYLARRFAGFGGRPICCRIFEYKVLEEEDRDDDTGTASQVSEVVAAGVGR